MVTEIVGARIYTSDPMATRRGEFSLGVLEFLTLTVVSLGTKPDPDEGRGADAGLVAVAHPSVVVERWRRPGRGEILLFAANDPVTKIEFAAAAVGIDEKESWAATVRLWTSKRVRRRWCSGKNAGNGYRHTPVSSR